MNIQTETHTNDCSKSQSSALMTDTGSVGRPRRNRYSKAAMLEDLVSIADPRMWPTYVAAALILAIPLYAIVSPGSDDSLARRAPEPQPAEAAEPVVEEPGLPIAIAGRAAPSIGDRADHRAQQWRMPASGDRFVLVARHPGLQANRPSRRHLPATD